MGKRTVALVILLLSMRSFSQNSEISARDGFFQKHFVDFVETKEKYSLSLRRFYNSHSRFIGLFGLGQCSTWEDRLARVTPEEIRYYRCGITEGVRFLKIKNRFFSKFGEVQEKDGKFVFIEKNISRRTFNQDGRLVSWSSPENIEVFLDWDGAKLKSVRSGPIHWTVKSSELGLIEEVSSKKNRISYKYKDDLMGSAVNLWKTETVYKYDLKKRLEFISYSDKTREMISYNAIDQVQRYVDRNGCEEKIIRANDLKSNQVSITSEKICEKQRPLVKLWRYPIHENEADQLADQEIKLDQFGRATLKKVLGSSVEYSYNSVDDQFPQLIRVIPDNKGSSTREYKVAYGDESHMIKQIKFLNSTYVYQYNEKSSKVSKILMKADKKRSPASVESPRNFGKKAWVEVEFLLKDIGLR